MRVKVHEMMAAILSLQRYPAGSWAFQPANGHEWKHYSATNWDWEGRVVDDVRFVTQNGIPTAAGIGRVRWSEYHSNLRRPVQGS